MPKYRYSKTHNDPEIKRIQKESEDNFLSQIKKFTNKVPKVEEMNDGDMIAYRSGSTKTIYLKIAGELHTFSLS